MTSCKTTLIEAQESNTAQVKLTPREPQSFAFPEANDPLAEGSLLQEDREKARRARPPTTARTAAEGHPVLSQEDIEHGMDVPEKRVTNLQFKMSIGPCVIYYHAQVRRIRQHSHTQCCDMFKLGST